MNNKKYKKIIRFCDINIIIGILTLLLIFINMIFIKSTTIIWIGFGLSVYLWLAVIYVQIIKNKN